MGNPNDNAPNSSSLANENFFQDNVLNGFSVDEFTNLKGYSEEENDLFHLYLASMSSDSGYVEIGDSYEEDEFKSVIQDSLYNALEENDIFQNLTDVQKQIVLQNLGDPETINRGFDPLVSAALYYDDSDLDGVDTYLTREGHQIKDLVPGDETFTLSLHTNEGMNSKRVNNAINRVLERGY